MKSATRATAIASALAAILSLAWAPANAPAQQKAATSRPAVRISDGVVKIALLEDMTSVYAAYTGEGSVTSAKLAIEDFGGKVLGMPIELLSADHQNKADIAANKAREWFDTQQLDMIADVAGTATALGALKVAVQKNKIAIFSGPGSTRLTNEDCSPVSIHWTYDSYAMAASTGRGVLKSGGDTWFFLLVDNVYGSAVLKDTSEVINAGGGKVLGSVRHPLNTGDFASFMLQAQSSKAKVIALGNAGGDVVNSIKAFNDFGLSKTQRLAGMLMFINDIHALGLQQTQGMLLTESFYWDLNDATRAWSRRFFERMKQMPNMAQAGVYSAVTHYLKAVQQTGTDDTATVMAWMKANPVNDMFAQNARIREDGRLIKDVYLFEVKKPEESKTPWDYYKLKATIAGADAFMPADKSICPLMKK